MYLGISGLLFGLFFLNVLLGSMGTAYLGVVAEMLTLLAATVFFVLAILKREAEAEAEAENSRE